MKGSPGSELARIFGGLGPFWAMRELELLGAVLYHDARAEGRREWARS
jgi:hypothetical protein